MSQYKLYTVQCPSIHYALYRVSQYTLYTLQGVPEYIIYIMHYIYRVSHETLYRVSHFTLYVIQGVPVYTMHYTRCPMIHYTLFRVSQYTLHYTGFPILHYTLCKVSQDSLYTIQGVPVSPNVRRELRVYNWPIMGTPEYQILIDAETEFEDFMGIQLIQENRQSIFYVKVNLINLSHVAELSILPVQI